MEAKELITVLIRQIKELESTIKSLQLLVTNGNLALSKEIAELKQEQILIQQRLDKLIGDVNLVNENKKLKTSYKDYSDKEIYELRMRTSLRKCAEILGCSVSTVQNAVRRYRETLFLDMEF